MKEKNIAVEILKILLWIFCGWILWLLIFSIFTPDEEEISDFFSNLAFILGVLTGLILTIILKYNRMNRLKQQIKKYRSNISIYTKKSEKLLKKANKVSDKYMSHEKEIQTMISKNREIKTSKEFQVLIENYPNLKSNENILELIKQIKEQEESISQAKVIYNESVLNYNTLIHNFPVSIVRGLFKLSDIEYFEEDNMITDEELEI